MAWDGGSGPRRVFVEDARGNGQFLRVTWHAERQQFVFSNWDGTVCVGATRVPVTDAAEVASILIAGLADATTVDQPAATEPPRTLADHLRTWWRSRGERAPVVSLSDERVEERRHTA